LKGWLYLITNKALSGVVKLGRSDDYPEALLKKLDLSGAVPVAYKLLYKIYVSDSFLILQNIRRVLWAQQKNLRDGWFPITEEEVIEIIRTEIALFIVDRLRLEIKRGYGNEDYDTTMRVIDTVLFLSENSYHERNNIGEIREVAMVVAKIMRNRNWRRESLWLNRITGGNVRYIISSNQH